MFDKQGLALLSRLAWYFLCSECGFELICLFLPCTKITDVNNYIWFNY